MQLQKQLENLLIEYPLPQLCQRPEMHTEEIELGDLRLSLVGLFSDYGTPVGPQKIFGAAVDFDSNALTRAYFELFERAIILEAKNSGRSLSKKSLTGSDLGLLAASDLWKESSAPEEWRYSLSNGVACHTTWTAAAELAAFELLERDWVLRSWFGGKKPERISVDRLSEIKNEYRVEFFRFFGPSNRQLPNVCVVGCLAEPKHPTLPLGLGFGAATTQQAAVERASKECLQTLAFLRDTPSEDFDKSNPGSPDFHQAYAQSREGRAEIRQWFDGKHQQRPNFSEGLLTISWCDLSEPGRSVATARAISESALPLCFGNMPESLLGKIPAAWKIHPIA